MKNSPGKSVGHFVLSAVLIFLLFCPGKLSGQEVVVPPEEPTVVKKGWTFGALPAVAYDSDEGFRYGALANFFNYGDGSTYPQYRHSIYVEWSRTTKGSGFNKLFYDSWYLIPETRTTIDILYLTEQALNFYGFNGYEAPFFSWKEDPDHDQYVSRMFYRHDRKLLRLNADFQQKLFNDQWNWIAGAGFFGVRTGPVDIEKLNKGKEEEDLLPDVPGIYQQYIENGIIPEEISDGGNTFFLKAGLIQDSRDNESNPMRGTWNEAFVMAAPGFLGNGNYSYLQLVMIHRHYLPLVPGVLTMANRIGYQGKIAGDIPFYMLPFIFSSYKTYDGFGGSKTVRGVVRNRIQGDGIAYGNFEFRYKFLDFKVGNQDIYLALSAFSDGALVVQKYPVNYTQTGIIPVEDRVHWAAGAGFRVVLNRNFIVAIDYGQALNKDDGDSGLYIGLDFLY